MRRGGLLGPTLAAFATVALVTVAIFIVLILSIRDLRDDADLSRHSGEVLSLSNRIEREAVDLQTGLRGYLLSGDEALLAPTRRAERELPGDLRRLQRLTADNPRQQAGARAIAVEIESFRSERVIPLIAAAR